MQKKKDWVAKLNDNKDLPKIKNLEPEAAIRWDGESMIIPSPMDVNNIMKLVPEGKLITINEIRHSLAKKFKTEICCPLTSGIFAWISAYAAEQEKGEGKADYTPWRRTLKSGGQLNEKYPGGIDHQKILLESEGHSITPEGKKYFVKDYEQKLFTS
ncbi:MAG: MGMT family protein [bacterium]|nr:MGMT family protein [bacterium]